MREFVHRYLTRDLSRRGFVRGMTRWGLSLAATRAILDSLEPLVRAEDASPRRGSPSDPLVAGTGASLLVAQLRAAGVSYVFNCNSSGTSAIFDALVDRADIGVIQCLHEGQMISVAQGYALASGETAFTLNGSVGLPNTLSNLYNAWKDRSPLVAASQREASDGHGGLDAFEEWDDYLAPSASFTRWRWSVAQAERIPEFTRRAFKIAATPPRGPVTLAFPTDVLEAKEVRAAIVARERFLIEPELRASSGLVQETAKLLVEARHPLLLVGPEVTRAGASLEVVALAESLALPVAQGERLFDDFPTDHPLFLDRHYRTRMARRQLDLVLCLGSKMPTEFRALPARAKVVHVSLDPDLIGRVIPTDVGIVAGVREVAVDLLAATRDIAGGTRFDAARSARFAELRGFSSAGQADRAARARARWNDRPLSWSRVGAELERLLDEDAIVVPELAGTTWTGRNENDALAQLTFGPGRKSKIGRSTGSALGWGVGAALGVKLGQPNRQVVALQGDGGFLFSQAESLWTMARHEIPVIVVVFNNRSYNGPRNKILAQGGKQAATGREMTCYLGDPDVDFARIAAGFGVRGEMVSDPGEIAPALRRAIAATREGRPYLIDAIVARTGAGADSTWYPKLSVAAARSREV